MRIKASSAAAAVIITATLGLSVMTASPAAAAETVRGNWPTAGEADPMGFGKSAAADPEVGTWRSYATNPINAGSSTWRCGDAKGIGTDISGRPCIIRTADRESVQGAVVILNNRSSIVPVEAAVVVRAAAYEPFELGEWHCSRSGVGARSWSVCFGETFSFSDKADTQGGANGKDLLYSPAH
ncbi:hypothetical protein [Actinoplanes sp. M2I2]|uniref:hypothetical protein n=1 Tax=Actinoplanes sp. M2I2 TaxID=1734444 RepID=UPI002021E10C|nr:hypothetical protein [Actinoplanes sp. M2I2]